MKVGWVLSATVYKGDLESPWIWNEPQRPVLSTFNHCWGLHNVTTFPVYFPCNVHPGSQFFMQDEVFAEQRCFAAMLTCAVRPSFFARFTVCSSPSSPLRSSFQSYSCGSESGGHPGGQERLLHCHEWRGHALQLGKLWPVLLTHLCFTSMWFFLMCTRLLFCSAHCSKGYPPFISTGFEHSSDLLLCRCAALFTLALLLEKPWAFLYLI